MDEFLKRRPLMIPIANSSSGYDYLVEFEQNLSLTKGRKVHLQLRFVPDRHLLSPDNISSYLAAFGDSDAPLEEVCSIMLADLNNQLIPRWVHITLLENTHRVVMEDRQPRWKNDALLSRLKLI